MKTKISEILPSLSFFKACEYSAEKKQKNNFFSKPRPFYSLGFMLKGKAIFQTSQNTIEVNKGEIIFLPIGLEYVSEWIEESNYITLHFNFEYSEFCFCKQDFGMQRISEFDANYIENHFKAIFDTYEKKDYSCLSAMSMIYNIFSLIFPKLKSMEKKKLSANIEKAVLYIEHNYNCEFDIPFLANIAFLSQSRFYELFKKETGLTPVDYKNYVRIKNSFNLLQSDMKIENIASLLGFNSSEYFRRVFKEFTNKNPKDFKKNIYNI